MRLNVSRALLLLAVTFLGVACSSAGPQPAATTTSGQDGPAATTTSSQNLFINPGFENGIDPWFSIPNDENWGTPVQSSDQEAHSGTHSAYLQMRAGTEVTGVKVFGAVQEVPKEKTNGQFPELLSGYYRVDDWVRGTPKQYIQFVVIVFSAANPAGNFQIRYPLAGIDLPPFLISNARFVFVSKDQPVTGRWVYFERNLRDDFKQQWGAVPTSFDTLRILFETRYDDKTAGPGDVKADVFFDDLYVGPAAGNPNKP